MSLNNCMIQSLQASPFSSSVIGEAAHSGSGCYVRALKSRQPCASTIKTRTDNVRFQDTTYVDADSLVVASTKVQRLKMKWTETESLKPLRGKQKY